jgi:hypothetical protein
MNVITLINLLCSDYAGPSHNGNGSNNDDAIGEGDGLGLSASNSFVEADDDESVGSVFEFIAHPDGDDDSTTDVENFYNDPTNDSFSAPFGFAADPNFSDQSESIDDGSVGDSSSGDSMGNNENMPLVDHDTTVAFKIVTSHPMRQICRKGKTKVHSSAKLLSFQARVKDHLLQLFEFRYCFNQNSRRFLRCNCLQTLKQECCFDSLAARIGLCLIFFIID